MRVLVVDDDLVHRTMAVDCLQGESIEAEAVASAEIAISLLERDTSFDAVVSDYNMTGMTGIEMIKQIGPPPNAPPVILVTGMGDEQIAAEAIKSGAADYMAKDLPRLGYLVVLPTKLREVVRHNETLLENHRLKQQVRDLSGSGNIVAASSEMQIILDRVRQVAAVDSTVLIAGESGTGKELIARALHDNSPRRNGAFIAASCGAFPESLLESELFGHEAGAFTGAKTRRIGRFEKAQSGTIFLDEISEISARAQLDLLRVLQEHTIERVGGEKTIDIDVRVVAASNKDLRQCVSEGSFREDLFYRLNVIEIKLPPLRDRPDDIAPIAYHFLKRFVERYHKEVEAFSTEALESLQTHSWPGNVRELENAIERAVVLAQLNTINVQDLPDSVRPIETRNAAVIDNLGQLERITIERVVQDTGWNLNQTAQRLGISRTTLYSKLKKHGIEKATT